MISAIMRVIHSRKPIKCQYESIRSGSSTRTLLPHTIVNNGHRWHLRAFDRKTKCFRDFICSRFTSIKQLDSSI
ncbi:WYL domain-containing protein [Providencia stuartii]